MVYIPKYGEVEISENDGCCSCFDGYEPNDDHTYQLKAGLHTQKRKRSTDVLSVLLFTLLTLKGIVCYTLYVYRRKVKFFSDILRTARRDIFVSQK